MALSEKDLKMWRGVSEHLTRMENDPEYCKAVEKELYKGAPKELVESVRQEMEKYETDKRNKQN